MKKLTLTIAALALCALPPLACAADSGTAGSAPAADAAKSQADLEKQLSDARAKLQEDAHRVADLSMQLNRSYYARTRAEISRHGHLGVDIDGAGWADKTIPGAPISSVTPGSPAEKAGLKEGDVITAINGVSLKPNDYESAGTKMENAMYNVKPGESVAITYLRDGKSATTKVTADDARDVIALRIPGILRRSMLGVDIGPSDDGDGVTVTGVTPDGPADKAGLQTGDELTAINGTALKPGDDGDARDTLFTVMDKVQAGDKVKVDYTRNAKAASATVTAVSPRDFVFNFSMPPMPPMPPMPRMPSMPVMPAMPSMPAMDRSFGFYFGGGRWGEMQLAPVSEGLGKYFGTDKGLLVLRAPKDSTLQLQDGDVITAIGGRDPGTPSHAMRILGSYGPGESVKLEIMRKGKPLTLNVALPKSQDDSGTAYNFRFRVPDQGDDDDGDGR